MLKRVWTVVARPLLWLLTIGFPICMAACYGMAYDFKSLAGKVLDKVSGNPVAGIKVSCMTGEDFAFSHTFSEQPDGSFVLQYDSFDPCDSILVEDVDGAAEGGLYNSQSVGMPAEGTELIVELELAN